MSVETRAIPAYKLISDSALSKKHEIRLKMLESYRNDVIEFQKFMQKMMGEFKSKKVSKNKADAFAKELKEQKFYKTVVIIFKYDIKCLIIIFIIFLDRLFIRIL